MKLQKNTISYYFFEKIPKILCLKIVQNNKNLVFSTIYFAKHKVMSTILVALHQRKLAIYLILTDITGFCLFPIRLNFVYLSFHNSKSPVDSKLS